jgi:diguanylate cyclase (GGDEF)-like protein
MVLAAVAVAASLVVGFVVWRVAMRSVVKARRQVEADRARIDALALDDRLTGLPNKRAFTARFEAELSRAAREYYSVAVVALELDHAAQILETGGAAARDDALVRLADCVQEELRAGDICGRVGESLFAVALVKADAHSAERVLDRMRSGLEDVRVGAGSERVSFSAGVAEFPRHGAEGSAVLRYAQTTLSAARAAGRIISASSSP